VNRCLEAPLHAFRHYLYTSTCNLKHLPTLSLSRVAFSTHVHTMPYTLSIPGTSLSEDANPYTIYALTIRTPLRTTVLPKRYSDFVALNSALATAVGSPPPVSLPGKAWSVVRSYCQ
jgi:hypothetical protein